MMTLLFEELLSHAKLTRQFRWGRFLLFFLNSLVIIMLFNILILFCFFTLLEIKKASLISEALEILFLWVNKPNQHTVQYVRASYPSLPRK
ncbi:MAG: hypothetical protein DWQ04_33940 [Chloroflexi bacterium]|nr:MAG: hypothetical protein DWQ04_33940 [Chloroflexota bacterium]